MCAYVRVCMQHSDVSLIYSCIVAQWDILVVDISTVNVMICRSAQCIVQCVAQCVAQCMSDNTRTSIYPSIHQTAVSTSFLRI